MLPSQGAPILAALAALQPEAAVALLDPMSPAAAALLLQVGTPL